MDTSYEYTGDQLWWHQDATSIIFQQTFSLFPKLPIEIRLKIWRLALRERRRIIELGVSHNRVSLLTPDPTVFNVNQESRGEAIQALTCFSFFPLERMGSRGYVQPQTDIIYLHPGPSWPHMDGIGEDDGIEDDNEFEDDVTEQLRYFATSVSDDERAKVQHLAIDMCVWTRLENTGLFSRQISRFLGLKTLVVVLRNGPRFWWDKVILEN